MSCYAYKGGIGTSSRIVQVGDAKYNLGSLVLTNHGDWEELRIDGVPVGSILGDPAVPRKTEGSIVMIVGTDAPLDSRQLTRIARRAILGLATTGSCSHNGSGDIVLAFSTANANDRFKDEGPVTETLLKDVELNPLFRATADSVAESIIDSLFKAETMEGRDEHIVKGLPIEETLQIMKDHGRLVGKA